MESILLTTSDGQSLAADLIVPVMPCIGGAVVCHPHPQYGGDRFNPVVDAVFRRLPEVGFATLRFDFRASFGGGVEERNDVVAALDELDRRELGPLVVAGYSFGAAVALATADQRITAAAAIAPPLAMTKIDTPTMPVLILAPQHDQFSPPDATAAATVEWSSVEVRAIESSDHFLVGRATEVADITADWLVERQ